MYQADHYLTLDEIEQLLFELVEKAPRWISHQVIGKSHHGRDILLFTIGDHEDSPETKPAFWLDAGTHAVEWTGVMAAVYAICSWVEELNINDAQLVKEFQSSTVFVVPVVSPDGLVETLAGKPAFRSTLRPPRSSTVRGGFESYDVDKDGHVRWMRFAHPAGSWVPETKENGEHHPFLMRPRTIDDSPQSAYFLCDEGRFINWDKMNLTAAPREFGVDLNRNYPVDWAPFSMFGMDSGDFPGSEPESRALLDAVNARSNIAVALTNHTYTGCLLCPPGKKDSPLPDADIAMMRRLALDATKGTGYRVFSVYPEFMYDPNKPIIGTWDDTLCNIFGVAAYTLELWNPYSWADIDAPNPIDMFKDPNQDQIRALAKKIEEVGAFEPWRAFEHPQLGAVELGGIDYRQTIRNPPVCALREECERALAVTNRLRRSLPCVQVTTNIVDLGEHLQVNVYLKNLGALATNGLQIAQTIGKSPAVKVTLLGAEPISGSPTVELKHLNGWFSSLHGFGRNPLYPSLSSRSHSTSHSWIVKKTSSALTILWQAGRGGRGGSGTLTVFADER